MKISIQKIEAKNRCGCKVVIDAIELESREVISGYYVEQQGIEKKMSWNAIGINDGSAEFLHIPKEYLDGVLAEVIKVAQKLNKLRGYEI